LAQDLRAQVVMSGGSLDHITTELEAAAEEAAAELLPAGEALAERTRIPLPHIGRYREAWSGSNIGPHALMYYEGLRPPPPGRFWDKEWGLLHHQPGWEGRSEDEVLNDIETRSGVRLWELRAEGEALRKRIKHHHDRMIRIAARVPARLAVEGGFDARRAELETTDSTTISFDSLARNEVAGQHHSRDSGSLHSGIRLAPHQTVDLECMAIWGVAARAEELVKVARLAAASAGGLRYLTGAPSALSEADPRYAGPPASGPGLDAVTTVVTAAAVVVVLLGLVAVAVHGILETDQRITPEDSSVAPWAIARAACGGVGVLALLLAGADAWHGVVRRRPDHVRHILGRPLAAAAAFGLGSALLIVFGIG
jgi:hypothetical protein